MGATAMNELIHLQQRTRCSPLQIIRAQCLVCTGGHVKEVASCDGDGKRPGFMSCVFHLFRLGKGRPSVKIMRKYCLHCKGNSYILVKECPTIDCLIHPFRFGKNPARAGVGQSAAQMALLRSKKGHEQKKIRLFWTIS
jgi:hypothetical protein